MSFFFERRFLPMWVAQNLGAITDNMLKQALIVGLTYGIFTVPIVTGDAKVPVAGALFATAMIIFAPYGGQFADKYDTKLMFRRTKLAEILIMGLATIGFLTQSGMLLVLALIFMGAQSAFFNPTRVSAMPKYLSKRELVRGNAFMLAGLYACITLGYVLGGGFVNNAPRLIPTTKAPVLETTSADGLYILGAVSITLAVLGWLAIRLSPPHKADAPGLKIEWNWFTLIKNFYGYVRAEPAVIRPIIGIGLFYFIGTLITVLVPLYARDTLSADGNVATLFMGLFTLGSLLGALSAAVLSKGKSGLTFAAIAVLAATLISIIIFIISLSEFKIDHDGLRDMPAFFQSSTSLLICSLFFLSTVCMGMYIVPLQAAVQRRVKQDHRARIIASSNVINAGAAIVGSLSNLVITNTPLQYHHAFIVVAALQGSIAFYMLRRRGQVKEGLYDEMLQITP